MAEPRVHRQWDRVPDWDDAEGYPETPEAFAAAVHQRVRETKIAWEELKQFDRVYKWCLMKSGPNRMQDCREFRKYRMNRIHWPMDLPPAGIETDSVVYVRPNLNPTWLREHLYANSDFNTEAKWQ